MIRRANFLVRGNRSFSSFCILPSSFLLIFRFVAALPLDIAAHAGGLVGRRLNSLQHRFNGSAEVFSSYRNSVAGTAGVELAAIDQATTAVEQEEIRRARSAVGFRHFLRLVVEIRESITGGACLCHHLRGAVVGIIRSVI